MKSALAEKTEPAISVDAKCFACGHSAGETAAHVLAERFNLAPGVKSEQFRADEIGLHRHTLLRARARGELAFVRIGDRILYAAEHIADWLARNEALATDRRRS